MAKDINLCEKYDATTIQQLYKIVTNKYNTGLENKNVFPVSLIQCIFDGFTGTRLDQILALCNSIYIPYAGSSEATRLKVGVDMRRKGLIVTFRDLNNYTWTQRYKNEDSISDEDWQNDDNWEAWDFDSLIKDLRSLLEDILSNINDYPDIKVSIDNSISEYIKEFINGGGLNDIIYNILNEILPNHILIAIDNYFKSEDGANLIKQYITEVLDDVIGEYMSALYEAIRDNERVTANALARHEMAITELQNPSN